MNLLLQGIMRFKYLIALLLLGFCVWLWPGVQRALLLDNSLRIWFVENDPALVNYEKYKAHFGNDESIILLVNDAKGVLTQDYFIDFIALTDRLESIPEVAGVLGPGNVQIPAKTLLGLGKKNLLTETSTPVAVKEQLLAHPEIKDQFFTNDYKAARFIITFKSLADFDAQRDRIINDVRFVVDSQFPNNNPHLGGVGIIFSGLNKLSQQDFGFFLGTGYLLMFGLMLFFFRSMAVLLYAITTISFSTYICLGVYGMLGLQLNLMTVLIPPILILLGILDVVHVINEHKSANDFPQHHKTIQTLKIVFKPCLYTTLTTMAGFLSLLSSPMAILKNFGIFTAFGIFLCFVICFLFAYIFLPFINEDAKIFFPKSWLTMLHNHVLKNKIRYSSTTILLVLLAIVGATSIKNDTYTLGYFPKNHRVVVDHKAIENIWGPYMPLEMMVTPRNGFNIQSPQIVQAGLRFSDSIKELSGIGSSFGFPQLYYAGLKNTYKDNADALLARNYGLSQIDRNLKLSYPQLRSFYVDDESGMGRITVFGSMSSAVTLNAKTDLLVKAGELSFKDKATLTPAGYLPLYAEIVRYAAQSQVYSLFISFLLVFFLVWVFLKKFKLAVLAIIPNLFPVAALLGFMGWFNINLDIATASVTAIVLSFCIDDTIHFMHRYKRHRAAGISTYKATTNTLNHVGVAIVVTSLILLIGYAIMLFAALKTVYLFGLLTCIALVAALYSHLILLPMLLARFDKD